MRYCGLFLLSLLFFTAQVMAEPEKADGPPGPKKGHVSKEAHKKGPMMKKSMKEARKDRAEKREKMKENREAIREAAKTGGPKAAIATMKEIRQKTREERKAEIEAKKAEMTGDSDKGKATSEDGEKYRKAVKARRQLIRRAIWQRIKIDLKEKKIPNLIQIELRKHARRKARLERIFAIAQIKKDEDAVARLIKLIDRERNRHEKKMAKLLNKQKLERPEKDKEQKKDTVEKEAKGGAK